MGYKGIVLWSAVGLSTGLFAAEAAPPGTTQPGNAVFKNEPVARALTALKKAGLKTDEP